MSESELNFQSMFDALSSPHMVLDREFRYVAVNEAYEKATLRGRKELIGRRIFDLFPNPGEGGKRLRASFDRVFETGKPDTLAFIPYDIPNPGGGEAAMEQRFWTAVHTPVKDAGGRVVYLIQNTVDVTEIVRLREAAALPFRTNQVYLLERAREAEEQHQTAFAEGADFRRLFQQAPGFFAVLSGPDHVFTFANDAYRRLVGDRPVVGKAVSEALPEVVEQGFVAMLDNVYGTGCPTGGEAVRIMLQKRADEEPIETFLDFSYDPIRNSEGDIIGVFVQGMDRTEAVRTLKRQRLLLDELNHRVKNTLATVQSIASQTLRTARDLPSARRDFEARIVALSNAHNLLSAQEWTSAALSDIIAQELAVYGAERFTLEGPPVTVNPKASIALALVIHELTTNAAKYGGLSVPEGRLRVAWRLERDPGRLVLEWTERGGPPATAPARGGFGTRLIETVVRGELGGEYLASYEEAGFACRIAVSCQALVGHEEGGTT